MKIFHVFYPHLVLSPLIATEQDVAKLPLTEALGTMLLAPHINYVPPVSALLQHYAIKGMVHVTGGGLLENIPRVLPASCSVAIDRDSWPRLPIFDLLFDLGKLDVNEAFRSFNMGIGYVLIVDPDQANEIQAFIADNFPKFKLYRIGKVETGEQSVQLL